MKGAPNQRVEGRMPRFGDTRADRESEEITDKVAGEEDSELGEIERVHA